MIDSFRERKLKTIKDLTGPEIKAIYRWLREQDQKIYVVEQVVREERVARLPDKARKTIQVY